MIHIHFVARNHVRAETELGSIQKGKVVSNGGLLARPCGGGFDVTLFACLPILESGDLLSWGSRVMFNSSIYKIRAFGL